MTKLGSDIARSPARLVDARKAKRGRRQFLSGGSDRPWSDRLGDVLAFAPFRQQGAAAPRIALAGRLGADDPIRPEMAKILPALAPGDDDPRAIEESESEGPDGAFASPAAGIFIGNPQLALRPDPASQLGKLDARLDRLAGPGKQTALAGPVAQLRRQHGGDLGQGIGRRRAERAVAALLDPAQAEDQRLDLLVAEHQGRQREARAQNIAKPRRALDRRTLPDQGRHVAVDGTLGNAEFSRQGGRRRRAPAAAQSLDEIEKARGAGHGVNSAWNTEGATIPRAKDSPAAKSALLSPNCAGANEMCGIVGVFLKNTASQPKLGSLLAGMLAQMTERGPDSAGFAIYGDAAPAGAYKATLFHPDPKFDWSALGGRLDEA